MIPDFGLIANIMGNVIKEEKKRERIMCTIVVRELVLLGAKSKSLATGAKN